MAHESVGWIYNSPDTGIEFSRQHPVSSGECPEATDVELATASVLLPHLLAAWQVLSELRGEIETTAQVRDEKQQQLAELEAKAPNIAEPKEDP